MSGVLGSTLGWPLGVILASCVLGQQPVAHYVQLPETSTQCVRDVVLHDFNGDGRLDLILSVGTCSGDDTRAGTKRSLRVHLRQPGHPRSWPSRITN